MSDYIETYPVNDVYADGIATVENLGPNFRTIYFVYARSPSGLLEKVVVAKLVRPTESLVAKQGGLSSLLAQTPQLIGVPKSAH